MANDGTLIVEHGIVASQSCRCCSLVPTPTTVPSYHEDKSVYSIDYLNSTWVAWSDRTTSNMSIYLRLLTARVHAPVDFERRIGCPVFSVLLVLGRSDLTLPICKHFFVRTQGFWAHALCELYTTLVRVMCIVRLYAEAQFRRSDGRSLDLLPPSQALCRGCPSMIFVRQRRLVSLPPHG